MAELIQPSPAPSPAPASQPGPASGATSRPGAAGLGGAGNQKQPDALPRLVREILSARGFKTQEEMYRFLSPTLKSLRDPFSLIDMEAAVQRLVEAFERCEKICLYCDYDLDGTSACAMLLDAFTRLGFERLVPYQPKRLTEGYGLHKEAIKAIAETGVTLILTADLGITAVEEVAYARTLGIDVIVTDHHLPKETLPAALAVVNPNRVECVAELGHLCGTGVAFYLVLALRRALLERGLAKENFDPKALLDCFVIGTVTDLVPLIEENRVLVKHGLLQLAQTRRPGLRALLQALNLWGIPLTSQDVAIRFAPKLNALSRMERGVRPLDLYLVSDEHEVERLVAEVLVNIQIRQASQKEGETEAIRIARESGLESCCLVWSPHFHRGVVGLLATRLAQEFGVPAFVGALDDQGRITGSARLPDGVGLSLLEALESNSNLLTRFGGHAAACGFELEESAAPALALALNAWFTQRLQDGSRAGKPVEWSYDAEASLSELGPGFMDWHERMSPFGAHFEPPIFLIRGVKVGQVHSLRGGHLRLGLGDSPLRSTAAVWFSPPKKFVTEGEDELCLGQIVDVLVEPQWNFFAGKKTLQLLVRDLRRSSSGNLLPEKSSC